MLKAPAVIRHVRLVGWPAGAEEEPSVHGVALDRLSVDALVAAVRPAILDPATAKAVAAQEDFKEGRYDKKQAKGDGDEAGDGDGQEAGAGGSRQ